MNCLFLEFSISYFQITVDLWGQTSESKTMDNGGLLYFGVEINILYQFSFFLMNVKSSQYLKQTNKNKTQWKIF